MSYKSTFDRNNAISVFLMGALPAVAGSAISFMLGTFFVWGMISLALRRFEFRLTRGDKLIAWTFTAFVALVFATALLGENRSEIAPHTLWLLPFLSAWIVIPRLRASPDLDYLQLFISGAAVGAIASLALGLVQVVGFGWRAEGGAGNAAVYGMMSLSLAAIGGLNLASHNRRDRLLAASAIVAGLIAVILSLTRGVALASIPVLVILFFYAFYAPRIWRSSSRLVGIGLALLAAVAVYGAYDLIELRVLQTMEEIDLVMAGEHTASIGERLRLWVTGWKVIGESPLWGHGIQNRMSTVMEFMARDREDAPLFTHAHNAYITFAIDGGLIVLAALIAMLVVPVVVAWRAERDQDYRKRFSLALLVSVIYAVCGMSQIMFKHDIMDSFYIFSAILIAASIPDRARPAPPIDAAT